MSMCAVSAVSIKVCFGKWTAGSIDTDSSPSINPLVEARPLAVASALSAKRRSSGSRTGENPKPGSRMVIELILPLESVVSFNFVEKYACSIPAEVWPLVLLTP